MYPWNTHNTTVRVRGISQCAKNQNRTHTRDTHDLITAGFPVPVPNPSLPWLSYTKSGTPTSNLQQTPTGLGIIGIRRDMVLNSSWQINEDVE